MTAAALLVVLGAALLMEIGGLSMAMGAFVAGVLLSESTFRHQLEADIEPFRGLLPGLLSMDGVEAAQNLKCNVLIIGFGRVGQIACQAPLAQGAKISIIDINPEVIRAVTPYGFKVYYGDGARHEILDAAGAHHARAIIICVDEKKPRHALSKVRGATARR